MNIYDSVARWFMHQFEDASAYKDRVIACGLPASPGAAVGQIVFSADEAEAWQAQGKSAILVCCLIFKSVASFSLS